MQIYKFILQRTHTFTIHICTYKYVWFALHYSLVYYHIFSWRWHFFSHVYSSSYYWSSICPSSSRRRSTRTPGTVNDRRTSNRKSLQPLTAVDISKLTTNENPEEGAVSTISIWQTLKVNICTNKLVSISSVCGVYLTNNINFEIVRFNGSQRNTWLYLSTEIYFD